MAYSNRGDLPLSQDPICGLLLVSPILPGIPVSGLTEPPCPAGHHSIPLEKIWSGGTCLTSTCFWCPFFPRPLGVLNMKYA